MSIYWLECLNIEKIARKTLKYFVFMQNNTSRRETINVLELVLKLFYDKLIIISKLIIVSKLLMKFSIFISRNLLINIPKSVWFT